jgi:hypothetical protein
MSQTLRFTLRFILLVAVVTALHVITAPAPGGASPYASSLASLGVGSVMAAPGCNSKYCAKEPGRKSPTCHQSASPYNCSASGNVCTVTAC